MERSEKLINIWNGEFPNYPLTVADLKKPHAMIGAFFQVFNRLGIDNDAVLSVCCINLMVLRIYV